MKISVSLFQGRWTEAITSNSHLRLGALEVVASQIRLRLSPLNNMGNSVTSDTE